MALPDAADRGDEDARLVARVRAGDERAFEAIVARHRPRLLAFARRILRDRSDTAEDVVQKALMRAHRALLRDDREIRLGAWLTTLTRNCALDEISRTKAYMLPLDAPAALPPLVDHDDPARSQERRATVRGMLEGIASVPAEQRHALLRREVDGASHAEIAAELGISGGASRSLVLRARTNLVRRDEAIAARAKGGGHVQAAHHPHPDRPRRVAAPGGERKRRAHHEPQRDASARRLRPPSRRDPVTPTSSRLEGSTPGQSLAVRPPREADMCKQRIILTLPEDARRHYERALELLESRGLHDLATARGADMRSRRPG
jgi:RNA polymerase sigma factor (sigma-70 family)